MRLSKPTKTIGLVAFSVFALAGCNEPTEKVETPSPAKVEETAKTITETAKTAVVETAAKAADAVTATPQKTIDLSLFAEGSFTETPTIVDCTTSAGTATQCYKFVTAGAPAGREPGPYCPRTTTDGAEAGGVWFNKEGSGDFVDLTGDFILNLSTYYGDDKWMLYDPETNKVRYTSTIESCLGAAKPNVEEQYMQNCIECELSYLAEDFTRTFLIPVNPIRASDTGRVSTAGIALDGSELSGPAPVDAILGAYTIAAFDDCGGHVNPHQGYHYHANTGCTDAPEATDDGHAVLIGYASDGYPMYAMKDAEGKEAEGLDECRGQTDDVRGYHYHVASPSENMFIGCLRGEIVQSSDSHRGPPGGGNRPAKPAEG
ncbi:YHYH protein [Leucothrix sargassi]|nr:YHYH protein [Leucothrix sargassi]